MRRRSHEPVACVCRKCRAERRYLQDRRRPVYEEPLQRLGLVDLFCGCGGMTLGVAEAARAAGAGIEVSLALDSDPYACQVYAANFGSTRVRADSVESWFDGDIGGVPTRTEARSRSYIGPIDILLAGPPCQGHSDLNNHTRREDPRNALYLRVARAADVLRPTALIVENVPAVLRDRGGVVPKALQYLHQSGYGVASGVVDISRLGLAQIRRRHVLLGVYLPTADDRDEQAQTLFQEACAPVACTGRNVRWAIGDLAEIDRTCPLDQPSPASLANRLRMRWLFKHGEYDLPDRLRPRCHWKDHTYRSIYGRLRWDGLAQTITTGFTSMGQGRYVHPGEPRTLTPHEAARLQGFPDSFQFSAVPRRSAWTRLIGNAVPPLLIRSFTHALIRARHIGRVDSRSDLQHEGGGAAHQDPIRG